MFLRSAAMSGLLALSATALRGTPPPEIPRSYRAIAPAFDLSAAHSVTVAVTSRRAADLERPKELEQLRRRVLSTLPRLPLTLARDGSSAGLSLELIIEPHLRYGMFHYQNAPYLFLILRERPGSPVVYCAWQRAGHFTSASKQLLDDLQARFHHPLTLPSPGSLAVCAAQAMRSP